MSNSRLHKLIMRYIMQNKTLFIKEWTEIAADCGVTMNRAESNTVNWKKDLYEVIMLTNENERYAFIEKARASTKSLYYSKANLNLNELNYFNSLLCH